MKVQLLVGDVQFKSFDIPDDSPKAPTLAMTMNHPDGKALLMRFRHVKTENKTYTMVLESAFTPADEHISGLETIVKAASGEE